MDKTIGSDPEGAESFDNEQKPSLPLPSSNSWLHTPSIWSTISKTIKDKKAKKPKPRRSRTLKEDQQKALCKERSAPPQKFDRDTQSSLASGDRSRDRSWFPFDGLQDERLMLLQTMTNPFTSSSAACARPWYQDQNLDESMLGMSDNGLSFHYTDRMTEGATVPQFDNPSADSPQFLDPQRYQQSSFMSSVSSCSQGARRQIFRRGGNICALFVCKSFVSMAYPVHRSGEQIIRQSLTSFRKKKIPIGL